MIYFIKNTGTQHIKIGYSRNPEDRLEELQTGAAHRLVILGLIQGGREYERYLHNKFSDFRLEGEWFQGDILHEVKEICRKVLEDNFATDGPTPVAGIPSPNVVSVPAPVANVPTPAVVPLPTPVPVNIPAPSIVSVPTPVANLPVVGTIVKCRWKGGSFYLGVITAVDGDRVHVDYSDGDKDWIASNSVSSDIIGTVVEGRWNGRETYYRGQITAIDGNRVHINYDDGGKEWTTLNLIRLVSGGTP